MLAKRYNPLSTPPPRSDMNPANTTGTLPRLPIQPEREPDDMTSFDLLARNGNSYWLAHHLGQPETSIVSGEPTLVEEPGTSAVDRAYPNLLVTFNAAPGPTGTATPMSRRSRGNRRTSCWRFPTPRPPTTPPAQAPVKSVARIIASITSSKRRHLSHAGAENRSQNWHHRHQRRWLSSGSVFGIASSPRKGGPRGGLLTIYGLHHSV